MSQQSFRSLVAVVLALLLAAGAAAQGSFVNYEDPQVKSVALANLGGFRFVAVCNTPDNSVEIYTTLAPYPLVARVPVGLSPVTVKWNGADSRLYVCNYLGDSISCIRLGPVAVLPSGQPTVRAVLERTSFVGDEPTDIEFAPGNAQGFVTLHSTGGMAMINLANLAVLVPFAPLNGPSPIAGTDWGVKAPRRIAALADGRTYVLNTMGGEIRRNSIYDVSLWVSDPNNPPVGQPTNLHILSSAGSTNFNFAIESSGRLMFLVTQIARNQVRGVDAVAAQPTGFVQSWLQVVDLVPGAPGARPQLIREQTAGTPIGGVVKPMFRSINLNRDYSQAALVELPFADALAQATDVVVIEDGSPSPFPTLPGSSTPVGTVHGVAITAFGSDKVAILRPDAAQPSGWAITRIAIPMINPVAGYSAVGPRSLVYDPTAPDPTGLSRPGLLFVANRLDNSLAVVSPWNNAVVFQRSLGSDPTPREIRNGRRFLYSAWFGSGNGMVSCSSCHVDARTDALGWRLGNLDAPGPFIPPHFHDGDDRDTTVMPAWPNDKPLTVTQTLQGLVNSHLEPFDMQFVTTNAPYHWRGDKLSFEQFNEAFMRLQNRSSLLSGPEMLAYTEFVNTIHHPPNPEQDKARVLRGAAGNPDDPNDGSGALLGRKLFHIVPMVGPRACVQCHQLPEGSSNTLTIILKQTGSVEDRVQVHPFETAATRNLFLREMVRPQGLAMTDLTQPFTITGPYGLLHAGMSSLILELSLSINDFVHRGFALLFFDPPKGDAVTEFVRQFDTGTAPAIGLAATVDPLNPAIHLAMFNLLEQQAREANVGVAVYTRSANIERGFWFDVEAGLYREENGFLVLTRAQIIALVVGAGDTVVVQATPTGSERRVASLTGNPAALPGPAPAQLALQPAVPNTLFVGTTDLTGNWDPNHPNPALRFAWDPVFGDEPISLISMRTLQTAVQGQFGVPGAPLRHEVPRRLRVSGLGIRNGAKLGIELPSSSINDPPARTIWFDLSPTRYQDGQGRTVWETAEEIDPMTAMAWLCGGYWAPGVRDVLTGTVPPNTPLAPAAWNRFTVSVRNEDGTLGVAGTLQTLTISDVR